MTIAEVLTEYFPDETEDFHDSILWSQTGFPCFWTGDQIDCLRMQLAVVKDKMDRCAAIRDDVEQYVYDHGKSPWEEAA